MNDLNWSTFEEDLINRRNKIEKFFENDLEKANGEGSRGGKVIGHTKSGKPIYAGRAIASYDRGGLNPTNDFMDNHKSYNSKDHKEAAEFHRKKQQEFKDKDSAKHDFHMKHADAHDLVSRVREYEKLNNKSFDDDISKGRTKEGVYANTHENRKKGVVGMKYGERIKKEGESKMEGYKQIDGDKIWGSKWKEKSKDEIQKEIDYIKKELKDNPNDIGKTNDNFKRKLNYLNELIKQNQSNFLEIIAQKGSKTTLYTAVNKKYGTNFKVGDIEEFEDDEMRKQLDQKDIDSIVEAEKKDVSSDPRAKKIIDMITISDNSYKDIKKVTISGTPKGNWRIYYNGKDTGLTIQGNKISENTIRDLGLEHHEQQALSIVEAEKEKIKYSKKDLKLNFLEHNGDYISTLGKDKFIIYKLNNQYVLQINNENKMKGTLSQMKAAAQDFINKQNI